MIFYILLLVVSLYLLVKIHRSEDVFSKLTCNTTDKIIDKSIVICCLSRDNEDIVQKSIDRLRSIGKHFSNYHIVIYENDSKDMTREIIKENEDEHLTLIECPNDCKIKYKKMYDIGRYSTERYQKMAFFREQYLNHVKTYFNTWDYMMVYDIDIKGCLDLKEFLDTFDREHDWDAFCVNGKFLNFTYDGLAYEGFEDYKNYTLLHKHIFNCIDNYVKSAFNGCTVYKMEGVLKSSYTSEEVTDCEHINFNRNFKKFLINRKCPLYVGLQGI